jgi:hypothetical protein
MHRHVPDGFHDGGGELLRLSGHLEEKPELMADRGFGLERPHGGVAAEYTGMELVFFFHVFPKDCADALLAGFLEPSEP